MQCVVACAVYNQINALLILLGSVLFGFWQADAEFALLNKGGGYHEEDEQQENYIYQWCKVKLQCIFGLGFKTHGRNT